MASTRIRVSLERGLRVDNDEYVYYNVKLILEKGIVFSPN